MLVGGGSNGSRVEQRILADPDGKWRGDHSGTMVDFKGLFSSGGRLQMPGTYTFKLQHAMREDSLREVVDIGFRVEKMEMN